MEKQTRTGRKQPRELERKKASAFHSPDADADAGDVRIGAFKVLCGTSRRRLFFLVVSVLFFRPDTDIGFFCASCFSESLLKCLFFSKRNS